MLSPLAACQICLPFPTRSLADNLIEAEHIALAREDPDQPFTLAIIRRLKGGEPTPKLDLFLDSQTRRRLRTSPDKSIICVYGGAGEATGWRRVATLDDELTPLIDDVLKLGPAWTEDPASRPAYFAPHLGSEHPQLATLAHLEVARAPYSEIRKLAGHIPVEDLRDFLSDIRMFEWQALYILLLAQSEHAEDHQRIQKAVESNARFSITLQTAAWATAFIEIREDEALAFLDQQYLGNPDRSEEEVRTILAALSVHGTNGHTHLRDTIIRAYQSLADTRPEFLPDLIKDLTIWQRWDLAKQVETRLNTQADTLDLSTTLQLRNYLRLATKESPQDTRKKDTEASLLGILIALLALPILLKWFGSRPASGSSNQ